MIADGSTLATSVLTSLAVSAAGAAGACVCASADGIVLVSADGCAENVLGIAWTGLFVNAGLTP